MQSFDFIKKVTNLHAVSKEDINGWDCPNTSMPSICHHSWNKTQHCR